MKNLPFVLWMVGWIVARYFGRYVDEYLLGNTYSANVHLISVIIFLFIWVFVGLKLYEPKEKKDSK